MSKLWNDCKTSFVVLVDFRVYYTRSHPIQPTRWGISLKYPEWQKLHDLIKKEDLRKIVNQAFGGKVRDLIETKASKDCYGCSVTHPSQKQHMERGCLSEWEDKWEAYFEESFHNVSREEIIEDLVKQHQTLERGLIEDMVNHTPIESIKNITICV